MSGIQLLLDNAPRAQRLCGNPDCRQPGHTIRYCNHISVQTLINEAINISHFSIAFNYPNFIKKWIEGLSATSITILRIANSLNTVTGDTNQPITRQQLITHYNRDLSAHIADANYTLTIRALSLSMISQHEQNSLRRQMINIGVPLRLTVRQRMTQNIARAEQSFSERTVNLNALSSQLNMARLALDRATLAYTDAHLLREGALTVYMTSQDEYEEYDRTHNSGGQRIQRKFHINTGIKIIDLELEEGEINEAEDKDKDPEECPLCYDELGDEGVELNCTHKCCKTCISRYFDTLRRTEEPRCSMCRSNINYMTFDREDIRKNIADTYCLPAQTQAPQQIQIEL
jgi:hypothetical protein